MHTKKKQVFLLITLIAISILVFILFKRTFLVEWDAFDYQKSIVLNERSGLILGRLGFIRFFSAVYSVYRLFDLSVLDFYIVVQFTNILFSVGSLCILFMIVQKIISNSILAFGTSFLFLVTKEILYVGSSGLTEPMMLLFLLLAYLLLIYALEQKNTSPRLLLFSALSFGIALSVREVALLAFPLYAIPLVYKITKKEIPPSRVFVFLFISGIVALVWPISTFLIEGTDYLESLRPHTPTLRNPVSLVVGKSVFYREFVEQLPYWFLSIIGLTILCIQKKKKEIMYLAPFIATGILTLYIVSARFMRYHLISFIPVIILSAFAIYETLSYMMKKAVKRHQMMLTNIFFLGIVLLYCIFTLVSLYPQFNEYDRQSIDYQLYGQTLIEQNIYSFVFMVGSRSALLGHYYIPLTNSSHEVIWSGWKYPEDLKEVIQEYTRQKKRVYIDFKYLFPHEKQHVYNLEENNAIYLIRYKNDTAVAIGMQDA